MCDTNWPIDRNSESWEMPQLQYRPSDLYAILPIPTPRDARRAFLSIERWVYDWMIAESLLAGKIHRGPGQPFYDDDGYIDARVHYEGSLWPHLRDGRIDPVQAIAWGGDGSGCRDAHVILRTPDELPYWDQRMGVIIAREHGICSAKITRVHDCPRVPWDLFRDE